MTGSARSTLAEILAQFLASLKEGDRQEAHQELNIFVRWCGRDRRVQELTAPEMEEYVAFAQAGGSNHSQRLEQVRGFLAFLKKQGFTQSNLASHLRVARGRKGPILRGRGAPVPQTHLTAEGHAQLQARLEMLREERVQVTEQIRRAAADKDFRENAPLEAARERLGFLEGRIRELEQALKSAVLLGSSGQAMRQEQVRPGSRVQLKEPESGRQLTYTLVDAQEANPAQGKISTTSPVGRALLDKGVGQEVYITVPSGTLHYVIERVEA
ncbi:MAG: GreA/GreB family elongation factor [Dehalococcoidia bacterium]